ncbi:MAG: hypothetical protein P1U56_16905 [Saprospiraceae bacterium]|nr:hypothetical protein [Saprospiraceae bacterium]
MEKTIHYIGGAEYNDESIEAIYTDEGRVVYPKGEVAYVEYLLKDHFDD